MINVDIGGGTSKIAVCADGQVDRRHRARCRRAAGLLDEARRRSCALEEAGRRFGADLGLDARARRHAVTNEQAQALAARMADRLFEAMKGGSPQRRRRRLVAARSADLARRGIATITFSGGVSEYIYGGEAKAFGDLGPLLAAEIRARVAALGADRWRESDDGIRATVIGASQYTMQVSGSTIFVSPLEALPLRNVPVIAPTLPLDEETHRPRRDRQRQISGAEAARSRRRPKSGRGLRAMARLGDLPPARRLLPRRRRRIGRRCWPTAIRSCSPATATSAA